MKNLAPRLRVLVFFAANPEEELTTKDIEVKFGFLSMASVTDSLRRFRVAGYLECDGRGGPGNCATWRAGPTLLREIGVAR
jgi:hypothetical protein